MKWRLGGDLGTNSLGTAVFSLGVNGIDDVIHLGSRIFSDGRDPKSLASSNMDRRQARLMARGLERKSRRKTSLLKLLAQLGLAPADRAAQALQAALDPYSLRAKGLDLDLTATEFGRVLANLNRRRGFRSSRLEAEEDEAESGMVASGISALEAEINSKGARSLGEYLNQRRLAGQTVRVRKSGSGKDVGYAIYPARSMLEQEFDTLWSRQADHLGLSDADRDAVRHRIFDQRPLKPVIPGKCTFLANEFRAAKAQPLAQRFEIVQKVNNLRYRCSGDELQCLSLAQRTLLIDTLARKGEMTFPAIRKLLGLPRNDCWFNLESEKVKKLPGSPTAKILSDETRFGGAWWDLPSAEQREIVDEILSPKETEDVAGWMSERFGLDAEQARRTAMARLPQGHVRLSLAALAQIVPAMEADDIVDADGVLGPMTFDKAVKLALGLNHSDFATERFDKLPYYGVVLDRFCVGGTGEVDDPDEKRLGRIPNPTVHVALNQVRTTVNALIKRFGGPPSEVVLELARQLPKGAQALRDLEKEQKKNQTANESRDILIRSVGLVPSAVLRLKLRLWEELDGKDPLGRSCVYTGTPISLRQALSAETEIDHILPYRLTLDDSAANKVLVCRDANRCKERRTPYQAFGQGAVEPGILPWEDILARATRLPENKRWRFSPDAMETFEAKRDFLDRQLVDTQYISRLAQDYLKCLFDSKKDGNPVWVIPGRLTAMIRGKLGLNKVLGDDGAKNREDHRHHAVDAFVAGLTSRSFLQSIATAAGRADEARIEKLLDAMPLPFAKFDVARLRALVDAIVVSHKVDHGRNGQLHEATAYGMVDPKTHDGFNLVRRKPVIALSDKEIDRVKDEAIRERLRAAIPAGQDKKAIAAALIRFSQESGINRVKVLVKEGSPVVIKDRAGRPYKAVIAGDVQRIEVWQVPGEKAPQFIGVSRFDANQNRPTDFSRPHRNAKKIMSIFKADTIAFDEDGKRRLMKVVRMSPVNKRLLLLPHNVSAGGQSDVLEQYQFSSLVRLGFRKVHVSPMGEVMDGGSHLPKPDK